MKPLLSLYGICSRTIPTYRMPAGRCRTAVFPVGHVRQSAFVIMHPLCTGRCNNNSKFRAVDAEPSASATSLLKDVAVGIG